MSVYPAHFCHPRKIKIIFFSKSKNKEIPDTRRKKKKKRKKRRKKDDTKTQHPQIIAYKNPKKSLVLEILSRSLFK